MLEGGPFSVCDFLLLPIALSQIITDEQERLRCNEALPTKSLVDGYVPGCHATATYTHNPLLRNVTVTVTTATVTI